jgi:peptidyl-prolyl cis-trans isomerase D
MVLDTLRRSSGSLIARILFALLVISFAAWGIGDFLTPGRQDNVVATVGDASISAAEVERQAEGEIRRLREMLGARFDREQARALGLYNAVLARLIQEAVLDQAARRAGLVVPDGTLRAEIEATPTFRGAQGAFDRERFRQFLMTAGFSEAGYVDLLRRAMLRDALVEAAPVPLAAPKMAVDAVYRERFEKRSAETILIRDDAQTAPAAPSDEEVAAFHRDNASRFTAPEYRALTLARMSVDEVAREIAVTEDDIRHAFETRAAEFDHPERRRLRQMVFADEGAAKRAAEALTKGGDFVQIARTEAKMDPSAVDLGLIARDQMPSGLADPVFALAAGGTSEPLKSPLGWHIVQVVAVEPARKATLDEVRAMLAKDVARDKAHDGLIGLANRFEDALGGGASLEDAAGKVGIRVLKVAGMDARGNDPDGKPVAGESLPPLDVLAQVAFATEENSESPLTEMGDDGYFALRVDKITPPALKPLDAVRSEVVAAWRARKLADLSKAAADAVAADARATDVKTAAAKRQLAASETGAIGRDGGGKIPQPVAAALFGLGAPGEVATVRVADGYHVVRLVAVHPADPAQDAAGVGKIAEDLAKAYGHELRAAFENALRRDIPVKIREANLDRLFR